MSDIKKHILKYSILCFLFTFTAFQVQAQGNLLSNETAESAKVEPAWPNDSLGRRSPRGTVEGFLKAVSQEDYTKAALYISIDSASKKKQNRVLQAEVLQKLLDHQGNILPYSIISDKEEGQQNDNLEPNFDRVGEATVDKEKFDILLESRTGSDGGPIWLFSVQTIQRIPLQLDSISSAALLGKIAPNVLEENKWGGVPLAHWMAMLIIIIVAYLLAWGFTKAAIIIIPLFWRRARIEPVSGIITAFALPIRLYLAVWIFVLGGRQAGISIIVRQRFSDITVVVLLVAVLLLVWQLVDVSSRYAQRRLARHGNQAGVSALLFLRRAAKIALVIMCVIMILSTFGFDVTTGLAALGIGGIALALGAQKTVENFVGSVTLIADQPVRVGDFCKVGDVVGTVEQIGMRSTRIRTLNRTIVTIPNGEFSSTMIENYAHRDRFWFHPTFGLRFETTPDQIRYLLVEIRAVLYAHPKVDPAPARVRFIEIGSDSLKLEVFAYIHAVDNDQFLEIQEDLFLRIMDIMAASGTDFAFPSQTVYLAKDQAPSQEKADEIQEKVKQWRESGDMHIPAFTPEYKESLKNTIPYPPEGSSVYKNDNSFLDKKP